MQDGERFVYSHSFTPLLISQLEDFLEGKETHCKLRKNKNKNTRKLELWPDSSANDYLFRSEDLEEYCYFEMAMDFEKQYNTYKEVEKLIEGEYITHELNVSDLKKGTISWLSIQGIAMLI